MNESDLSELKSLVAEIRASAVEAKKKEQSTAWTKWVSLSTIFIAVLATIAGGKGGGYSSQVMKQLNEATYMQASASDQWSYFQAKGVKQSIAELDLERNPNDQKLQDKIKRYDSERKAISAEAKGFEEKRDLARVSANKAAEAAKAMGLAISVFQLSIAIAGICLVVKKRWLWYVSMLGAALATAQMLHVIYQVAR